MSPTKWIESVNAIGIVMLRELFGRNAADRSVENETLLTIFLIDKLISVSYNMANGY
jgi:hypothetical protein